ncbi:9218_t:CDS:2 [Acaulospora morrowiae]|uniref:9218_t:CDS:1 n=1 Tax=Acaulospora morrowiae TaxID=94023 RepID=A0A9N9EX63_9GLOM|nr:9218_t:CDS:2 [Acaulospora morrowiae]
MPGAHNSSAGANSQKVFPDPSEDLFWQNAFEANERHENDEIWNPQKIKEQQVSTFVIPPPPLPPTNNITRHSRKSSRVSWSLQTDSERHIELLETKLKEVVSQGGTKSNSKTAPDEFEGYYPEENLENMDEDLHDPLESDEGLWLLWKFPQNVSRAQSSTSDNWNRLSVLTGSNINNSSPKWIGCGTFCLEDD